MRWVQKHALALCISFWVILFSSWTVLHICSFAPTQFGLSCLIVEWTGFYCPSCGVTRMVEALIQWDIAAAFAFHPVFFMAFIALLGYAGYLTFCVLRTKRFPRPKKGFFFGVLTFLLLLLVFTVIRNF